MPWRAPLIFIIKTLIYKIYFLSFFIKYVFKLCYFHFIILLYNVCNKVTHISELIEKQSKLQLRGQIITIFVILRGGFSILNYCLRQNYHHCSRILTRAGLPTFAFLLFTGAESASGMQFDIGTAATSQLTSKLEMEIIC